MRPVNLGPEYPAFLLQGRERLPLLRERRWSRVHGNEHAKTVISRLMDGSASITLGELVSGWPEWTARVLAESLSELMSRFSDACDDLGLRVRG